MSGFTMPSATLLAQSILSGVFVGALYGLLGLGLSLSWGLLRLINLAHFAFAFLAGLPLHDRRGSKTRVAITPTGGSRQRGGRSSLIRETRGRCTGKCETDQEPASPSKIWGRESWIWSGPSTRIPGVDFPRWIG